MLVQCIMFVLGYRYIRDLVNTDTMKELGAYLIHEEYPTRPGVVPPEVDPKSDEYVEEWMKQTAALVWHPAGSCKMGRVGDPLTVVDPQLR